jgi:uridine kinase
MRLIVIGGGSGSGKTTLAHYLSQTIGAEQAPVLCVDQYYRSLAHLPPIERESVNFDHPDAFDWEYFAEHISRLMEGESVLVPEYDYASHSRMEAHALQVGEFLILEGIMALFPEFVREKAELTVFVDASEQVRYERRLARDVSERGRTPESVKSWWRERVQPMFVEHCAPLAQHADLIVSGEIEISECALPVLERIRAGGTHNAL